MTKSYAVTVHYSGASVGRYSSPQVLFLQATTAGLLALLQTLDDSAAVYSFEVSNTLTIPDLTKFTKLTRSDLGLPEDALHKLK